MSCLWDARWGWWGCRSPPVHRDPHPHRCLVRGKGRGGTSVSDVKGKNHIDAKGDAVLQYKQTKCIVTTLCVQMVKGCMVTVSVRGVYILEVGKRGSRVYINGMGGSDQLTP